MEATVYVKEIFNWLGQVVIDCVEDLGLVVWVTFLLPCKLLPKFYAWTFAWWHLQAWSLVQMMGISSGLRLSCSILFSLLPSPFSSH